MDLFEDEIILFFKHLTKQEVSFILVGGLAVNYHGFNRSTGDIDIWINDSTENRKKFITALTNYGIEGAEVYTDLPFIAGVNLHQFRIYHFPQSTQKTRSFHFESFRKP